MIAKALRGWRPGGLLRYLFGPGKDEEHRNPRVVASWDHAPWLHHPVKLTAAELGGREPGEFDFNLGPLTTTMQELAEHAGLPLSTPPAITDEWAAYLRAGRRLPPGAPEWLAHYRYDPNKQRVVVKQGYVWHCPIRLHPKDRTLTDREWESIAERLMRATGIHQAGCRWIAVRHADDHIHLVATLVSERTGRRFPAYRDFPKLREECQRLEQELGLVSTASADKTAPKTPTRAEKGKAERLGRTVTAREELRRVVAQCAASAVSSEEFLDLLRWEGLNPKTTSHADGRVRGYSVALPGDLTAKGSQVRYSGTALAADLTWPKLLARWASTPAVTPVARSENGRVSPAARRDVLDEATAVVDRATAAVREGSEDVDGIAHAVGEMLASLSRGREGREPGPLTDVMDRYDRAARTPYRVLPHPNEMGAVARELRWASRRIAAAGALSGRGNEKFPLLALLLAVAGAVAEIAAWKHMRRQEHQAVAARAAAGALTGVAGLAQTGRHPIAAPPVAPPTAGRQRRHRPVPRRPVARQDEPRTRGASPG